MTNNTMHHPDPTRILKAIARRSICTLGTVSPAGRPHVATVIYELVDGRLYVSTTATSRKARNVASQPCVGVSILVRRLPLGAAPSTIQFQGTATLLASNDPEIAALVDEGRLVSITGHGELDLPDGCFIRIGLPRRVLTYGLGMSLLDLARNPLDGAGAVSLPGSVPAHERPNDAESPVVGRA